MDILSKSTVVMPSLPEEVVHVPELGGSVRMRGLLFGVLTSLPESQPGGTPWTAHLLERVVIDADSNPIASADQWHVFMSAHPKRARELVKVATRLNGQDEEENEKNSSAPTSE